MIQVDLAFVPPGRRARSVVVFDVLRMTTTAAVLLDAGLARLTVVADPEAARREAASSSSLLLGERQGVALPGFDGGNSPLEARELPLEGRGAVLCTTNGSFAVEAAHDAEQLLLGAVVNAAAVAEALLAAGATDVSLVCAGTHGAVSLDDVVGAACVLHELTVRGAELEPTDACRLALKLVERVEAVPELLEEAAHARFLRSIGFGDDVAFAAQRNVVGVVPLRESVSPPRFTAWRPGAPGGR